MLVSSFAFHSHTILPLEVSSVTVRESQGLQRFESDNKVLFDTFSFKKKYYFVYMTAAQNKFLRIYYARVKECLAAFDAQRDSEN